MSETEQLIEKAFSEGRIGNRQKGALLKHAAHHSEEHMKHMLMLMGHTTFKNAHKQAMATVGK